MRLAGSNPNEKEAAAATAKAQDLMLAYNLSVAVVEQMSGQSAKRTDEMVKGGMHKYQRELWRHISELNFCLYWTQKNRVGGNTGRPPRYPGHTFVHEHRLVGREVNVIATKNMAQYLTGTINRMCEERFLTTNYFKLTSFDAMAFREGIADRLMEKIATRRREAETKERREKDRVAREASAKGISLASAVTIASVNKREEIGNYDFLHGEGAWAKKEARMAAAEKRWDEAAAERAKAEREAEQEYARWAAANPEEAAREARKEAARERAADRRASNRSWGYRERQDTKEEKRKKSGEYHRGYEKGDAISLDEQVDKSSQRRIAK